MSVKKSFYSFYNNWIGSSLKTKMAGLWFISLFFRFFVLNIIYPYHVSVEYSQIVTASNGTVIHAYLTPDDKWRMYLEMDEITPQIRKAIIDKEDKYFYYHPGVNIMAVCRALYNNIIKGKRTSGASTITMQVARMLHPRSRTYGNKLFEIFRALQLEWNFSKDEILQLYLNLVPYGGNIEGLKSASIMYFDKMPNHLSVAEITSLAIIPNRPNSLLLGQKNEKIKRERDIWLYRFFMDGVFNEEQIQDALHEPLTAYRHGSPNFAPQFSYRMKQTHPNTPIIKTNLNLELQQKVQHLTTDYIKQLYIKNVNNAAVLVIDNKTGAVLAYIGSADFNNKEDAGQVDGVKAVRSPGSTLKPLLYGLAMDYGLATPKSVIYDVPINYSGYAPENYDGLFHGKVTTAMALENSLNIPAVKTLYELGTNIFINKLADAGFKQIDADRSKLGLSTILGGCGVRLEELVHLYNALANGGRYRNFSWIQSDSSILSTTLLSVASTFMITEILTNLTRPDLPLEWSNTANLPKVAWKTGTSYGRRDAWSIGYNVDYTIGIWVGNFSAKGVPDISGSRTAAPLLFSVFNSIDYNSHGNWFKVPLSLDYRLVCSESGLRPNDFCKNQIMDYYIPGISDNQKCNHKKTVWVNNDTTIAYCSECLPSSGYREVLYDNYPPELIEYFNRNMITYLKSPPHNEKCERVFTAGGPTITSPVEGIEYYIDKQDSMQLMLSCNASNDVKKVYWYINNRFYIEAPASNHVFFSPAEGATKISCTDDKGRNTDLKILVKKVNL